MPIVKHNKLIETSYKLNSREQFFVLYLISKISKSQNEFEEYQMHYSEIEKILNFDGKRRIANKNEVFELMRRVNSCQISYERGSRKGESVWFQYYERDDETGHFYFRLSDKLKEYLLELKEHFTQYNIQNIVYLSANGIRMFELLKRYQFREQVVLSVEDIKFYLGIEGQYPKTYDFKRYVLNKTQDELELYTDVKFKYEEAEKKGKTVKSFRFYIYDNVPKHQPNVLKLMDGDEVSLNSKKRKATSQKKSVGAGESQKLKMSALTRSQFLAYDFLANKGVNKTFILTKIFPDSKIQYEVIHGYEDIYIKMLWAYLLKHTTAKSKPAAFVSWWKNGRFTNDQVHGLMLENLTERKKSMSQSDKDMRETAKGMTQEGFEKYRSERVGEESGNFAVKMAEKISEQKSVGTKSKKTGRPDKAFDFENFKLLYPEIHRKIEADRTKAMEDILSPKDLEKANYQSALMNSIEAHCEKWFWDNV